MKTESRMLGAGVGEGGEELVFNGDRVPGVQGEQCSGGGWC